MLKRHRVGGPSSPWQGQQTASKRGRPSCITQRLLDRQLDARVRCNFQRQCLRERFSCFRLSRRLDLPLDGPRSRIMEIVAVGPTVFGLTENGVCVAFDIDSGRRICVVNADSTEVVRSLFHNKTNGTLITVSVHAVDQYSSLRCRANPVSELRAGVTGSATALFTTESLRWPGFVEFDDCNLRIVTYSADSSTYKVWSMADPAKVLYHLQGDQIAEIKISPGIMLLVLQQQEGASHVPLKLLSIESGQTLVELDQPTVRGKKIEFIEQFNEKLLLKQARAGPPLHLLPLLLLQPPRCVPSSCISSRCPLSPAAARAGGPAPAPPPPAPPPASPPDLPQRLPLRPPRRRTRRSRSSTCSRAASSPSPRSTSARRPPSSSSTRTRPSSPSAAPT